MGQNSNSAMLAGFNSLQGILDKIHHLTIGRSTDSIYLKLGPVENVTFGYGQLVNGYSNYNSNSLYHPLGATGQLRIKDALGIKLFFNDVTKPLVGGAYLGLNPSVYHLGLGYVYDVDQYRSDVSDNTYRFSSQKVSKDFFPDKFKKPSNVHIYTIDFGVEIFSYDDVNFNMFFDFSQKLLNGNDGYTIRLPYFAFDYQQYSFGGGFLVQQGRLLSRLFNSHYQSNRYRIKNGETSFDLDTVITLTNAYSKKRTTAGFDLYFKTTPYKGIDVQFEWTQDFSNRKSMLFPIDTTQGHDAPGDFSFKLSGRINEQLVKYLRYGELYFIQNHGTTIPYGGTFFKSWDFESGLYALSKPLILNLAFELGMSFFYFDIGTIRDNRTILNNKIAGNDVIFELSAGVRWGFL
jgi:hypothetical protein